MKTILHLILTISILTIAISGFVMTDDSGVNRKLNFPSPLDLKTVSKTEKNKVSNDPDLENSDWYSEAMNNLSETEYNITFNEEINSYQSPNRANNMRFIYHKDGFTVEIRDDKIPLFDIKDKSLKEEDKKYEVIETWSIDLRVQDLRRETFNETTAQSLFQNGALRGVLFSGSEIQATENKAFIEYDNMRIDYTNDNLGMRQDFIIKKRPEGEGKLRLDLAAETKLKMIVGADALMFKDKIGDDKMKYSSLKCWDANGRELRAYFEKNDQLQISNDKLQIENHNSQIRNSKFQIVINDENAVYPITIDPLSSSPDWSVTGNFSLGYSVKTAGDVNGDGYSDVIVGAPFNDAGKVFGYYGSATGLSIEANWSVSDLGGAESSFGLSVSTAGDVNGDGYSDVIIGNPNKNGPIYMHIGNAYVYHGSATGLSPIPNWTAEGYRIFANEQFGYSVSTAGDVNGDGYSDVVIGAIGCDANGKAFLWHGSSSGLGPNGNNDNADWITAGGGDYHFRADYGCSVSTAGDINGDGYSDVIVGERNYSTENEETTFFEGKAFVFNGSASGLSATSNWSGESNQYKTFFGTSVSTAGDVNGDGYSDIIIGAVPFSYNEGAYIWYGSSSGLGSNGTLSNADWVKESGQDSSYFGFSVSTAGDVNGDGYSDVIIGAKLYDNGQINEGKVFAYFGSPSGPSNSADWTEEINTADAEFGNSVSTAGDVNGDGFSDVIVGAQGYGGAYVYHGFPEGLASASGWSGESNQAGAESGYCVSTAGDVNSDGFSDVIIGAPFYDNGQTSEGRVFCYYGSSTGPSTGADWTEEINQAGANFGHSVSTAGDVNGDGYGDIIIGASLFDNLHTNEGKAYVYHGSSTGLPSSSNWATYGTQDNALYGHSVSTAGDVNGDGFSDVIVGAVFYDNGQTDEGKVFVFHGSAGGLFLSDWTTESNQTGASLGSSVSSAGDVNGDGFSDVIIGEPYYDNGSTIDQGRVLVFHGSPSGLPASSDRTITRNQSEAFFGYSVSVAGDVNGDGYSDVIIGAPFFDNALTDEGKIFVYHGSESGLSSSTNWNVEGIQANEHFGWSVSTAGDVNGDGYSDVIAGAPEYDNGQTDEGRSFVYHGSPSGLSSTSNWTAEGNTAGVSFGYCISTAGDVNSDGYSDVIVGAPFWSNGQSGEGRGFVYYGNGGKGLRSTVKQYKPLTFDEVYSGGLTNSALQVRLSIFGRSSFGRADGKIVYEYKPNGVPFSGSLITNSVSSSGSGNFLDLSSSGGNLNKDVTVVLLNKEHKWRARVQYKLTNNPYQKLGPWKYYSNYVPVPFGGFKAQSEPLIPTIKILNMTMFIQGFYDATANTTVRDTVRVYLRNSTSPYAIVDSAKTKPGTDGAGTFYFQNVQNGVSYYIHLKHRNSIETWSTSGQSFSADVLTYNFSSASTKAYGNNMSQIDTSPLTYGIYSGDINRDGFVNLSDVLHAYNDANTFVTGYKVSDLTGNNITDLSDVIVAYNNSNLFVVKITP